MGRAPCCDKANVKKGPWSPEEDTKLKAFIEQHGTGGNWIALPQKAGLKRCGKSCRLRWLNYLRPDIRHGGFSEDEDNIICSLYASIGSRWSIIAAQLPGRTDNDIKNYWNTRLKKKLLGKRKDQQTRRFKEAKNMSNGTGPYVSEGMSTTSSTINAIRSLMSNTEALYLSDRMPHMDMDPSSLGLLNPQVLQHTVSNIANYCSSSEHISFGTGPPQRLDQELTFDNVSLRKLLFRTECGFTAENNNNSVSQASPPIISSQIYSPSTILDPGLVHDSFEKCCMNVNVKEEPVAGALDHHHIDYLASMTLRDSCSSTEGNYIQSPWLYQNGLQDHSCLTYEFPMEQLNEGLYWNSASSSLQGHHEKEDLCAYSSYKESAHAQETGATFWGGTQLPCNYSKPLSDCPNYLSGAPSDANQQGLSRSQEAGIIY